MSCCGSKRQTFLPQSSPVSTPTAEISVAWINFRYTGQRSMMVTGGITGQRYRFPNPGEVVPVDGRDAPGMGAVPWIERVRE